MNNEKIKIDKTQTWEECAVMYHQLWVSASKKADKWEAFTALLDDSHYHAREE
jgi:hypothetical protein